VLAAMRGRLDAWMTAQGDRGDGTTSEMKQWQGLRRLEGRDHLRTSNDATGKQAAGGLEE
jgi:hypothetical protein